MSDAPRGGADHEASTLTPTTRRAGDYTWAEFMAEHGAGDDAIAAYRESSQSRSKGFLGIGRRSKSSSPDWQAIGFDPRKWLGVTPTQFETRLQVAGVRGRRVNATVNQTVSDSPVRKDAYTWAHFQREFYFDDDGQPPKQGGRVSSFDPAAHLGFDPVEMPDRLTEAAVAARELQRVVDRRTVNVDPSLDEDAFFTTPSGHPTLVSRYDLEKAVSLEKKGHFLEVERYWVDKPYAFVVIFHSLRENEKKYYLIYPHMNDIESSLMAFLAAKLRTAIKYSDDETVVRGRDTDRAEVLHRETMRLLSRYDLYQGSVPAWTSPLSRIRALLGQDDPEPGDEGHPLDRPLDGLLSRPEPAVIEENAGVLSEYQVEKLLYLLRRNFLGYERIDGIKHDINVEDISCDGYASPVFVYHTSYENLISNVQHEADELDDFVVKLAQRSGKGISQRRPQVDATLPDGSRAQLTLGTAVSDHGSNYTIRQFKDVPFTPVDLINWKTFSLEQLAFLWLCIENKRSVLFAGGTASGKTTSLNAVSLFIPNNAKIVSIEDTREVELPQRNWIASVTRPAFGAGDHGDVDEFDLLEAALRQRPDYIVMGEVRGEEGRTLFQVMSTGHTTLTTFHADDVSEVLKRFTTEPINVSKTLFTSLDLVSVQTQTRIQGRKVRRTKTLTEINHYDPENDEINVQDVFEWEPETDDYLAMARSNTLQRIMFDRGWSRETLERELFEREVVLAYLVVNGLNDYAQVAATLQGYVNDPETILTLIATDRLADHLDSLRQMESVVIDVDPEKEALVPRPDPLPDTLAHAHDIIARADSGLLEDYRGGKARSLADVLASVAAVDDVVADPGSGDRLKDMFYAATLFDDEDAPDSDQSAAATEAPLASDGGQDADDEAADSPADADDTDDGASAEADATDESPDDHSDTPN
jgi:flagellar protein FlaI